MEYKFKHDVMIMIEIGKIIALIFILEIFCLITLFPMDYIAHLILKQEWVDKVTIETLGIVYILFMPLYIAFLILRSKEGKEYIINKDEYIKKAIDAILLIGSIMLLSNQYWKIDIIRIIWGNEYFWGIPMIILFLRFLLGYDLLKKKFIDQANADKLNKNGSIFQLKRLCGEVKSTAYFSEDRKYRYRLIRIWSEDLKKKKALIIMLNPSKATEIKLDMTIMNVSNFLIDNNFRGVDVVNLFSYITTDYKKISEGDPNLEKINDEYIINAIEDSDVLIIAWGKKKEKFIKNRIKIVEEIIKKYRGNKEIQCFENSEGKQQIHPRVCTAEWKLVEYQ